MRSIYSQPIVNIPHASSSPPKAFKKTVCNPTWSIFVFRYGNSSEGIFQDVFPWRQKYIQWGLLFRYSRHIAICWPSPSVGNTHSCDPAFPHNYWFWTSELPDLILTNYKSMHVSLVHSGGIWLLTSSLGTRWICRLMFYLLCPAPLPFRQVFHQNW